MTEMTCRACRQRTGNVVLDLGEQPASDFFPRFEDPGPDPVYPLQMWLCSACHLAQLVADPTVPDEPKGAEPAALVSQAADAVSRVAAAGLLPAGGRVAEYGSPHGGSWLRYLAAQGLSPANASEPADVVLDCFGLMHSPDQAADLAGRVARVAADGVLLLQYHSLATIIRREQWNALRHGHYAYYSAAALVNMLDSHGFKPRLAWQFPLYGGTVLLAASRGADRAKAGWAGSAESVQAVLAAEASAGVSRPDALRGLQRSVWTRAEALHDWLVSQRSAGRRVLGYGAASRAVSLLRQARADSSLLPAVVDASPAKHGLRMPGTDIPIVGPAELAGRRPDSVLLLLSDLRAEVRAAFPEVERTGGRWTDADTIGSASVE
jgi:C-methyltransferase C-terminal domain/Putative zinc binding domain